MNIFKNKLFTDVDKAIDYMIPATIPPMMIEVVKGMFKNNMKPQDVLDKANGFIVAHAFNELYADTILKLLYFAGEDALYLQMDANNLTIGSMLNGKAFSIDDLMQFSNNYIWLYIKEIKNERLYKYIVRYMNTIRYIDYDHRSAYIQLIPSSNLDVMDKFTRALTAYL